MRFKVIVETTRRYAVEVEADDGLTALTDVEHNWDNGWEWPQSIATKATLLSEERNKAVPLIAERINDD